MRTLIILLILSGSGYWWHTRRERFKEWEILESSIKNSKRRIAERENDQAKLTASLEPLRKGHQHLTSPQGSPEQLEIDVEALKESLKESTAQLEAADTDFMSALNAVRDKAKLQNFPVLKLPSGDELKDCSITKFGEGYLNLSHKDGIVRVQADDLPKGWVEKYSIDYVSRVSQADKEAIAQRVAEATTKPLDLKNAQLGELDARISDLNAQLLSMSVEIRDATRKADLMIRDAYRIALEKGNKGEATAAKRAAIFSASKKVETGREAVRAKYKALRDEKLALEQQRNELRRKRVTTVNP